MQALTIQVNEENKQPQPAAHEIKEPGNTTIAAAVFQKYHHESKFPPNGQRALLMQRLNEMHVIKADHYCYICGMRGHKPGACWYWSALFNECRNNVPRREVYDCMKTWA